MILTFVSGLNVVEVAHDMQLQVSKYVRNDLKLLNSFDTWHGTYMYECSIGMIKVICPI